MSASASTSPHDPLGLDGPFAEGIDAADRIGPVPAWSALGESPYAESPDTESPYAESLDGRWDEEPEAMAPAEEGLAWLDMESASHDAQAFDEDLSLTGEDVGEDVGEHASVREWNFGEAAGESEYLDDEERDAAEAFESLAQEAASPLTEALRAWVLDIDRSALERLPDAAARKRFLQQDWSGMEFPGNVPKGQTATAAIKAQWALARGLFAAVESMARERRVPKTIRFRTRPVHPVPGQRGHRLYAEARDAFVRMHEAAQQQGVKLSILSSWRSPSHQARLSASQTNPNAVARGVSAHMYGLALDLRMSVPDLLVLETCTRGIEQCTKADRDNPAKAGLPTKMANLVRMYRSPVYKWMLLRAREFGWYPYRNEPWHWEYNPPGLKARFEGEATHEQEQFDESPDSETATWSEADEDGPHAEAECNCRHHEAPSTVALRTFTPKALGVKVAMLVTRAAQAAREIELLVYAHGLDVCRPVRKDRPATFITDPPFQLGKLVEASGRPIVLVVPFLDWEHLQANGMAFGKKWHRFAEPAVFNQVMDETLAQVRAMTGSAATPTLQRLVLAGHSRAYGFFDALAHAHASPQMRVGALSRPLHVWALDTTYSAPIADWKAWLRSREDLQATVIYRHGTYKVKGSDVERQLTTGVRGKAFGTLRASSHGRLDVRPVAASRVSHCGIPAAYLPGLLAALPAADASREDSYEAPFLDEAGAGSDPAPPVVIADYPRYARPVPPGHTDALDPLIAKIIATANAGGSIEVAIVGHADFDAKGRDFETKVSQERADAARETLLSMLRSRADAAGLAFEKVLAALDLSVEGKGTKVPKKPRPRNENERKENRRVEFYWKTPSGKRTLPPLPPPDGLTYLQGGATGSGTDVRLDGERVVRFDLINYGNVRSRVTVADRTHAATQERWLDVGQRARLEFPAARAGRIDEWTFRIQPDPYALIGFSVYTQQSRVAQENGFGGQADEWSEPQADEDEGAWFDRLDASNDERDAHWGSGSSEDLDESAGEAEQPLSFAQRGRCRCSHAHASRESGDPLGETAVRAQLELECPGTRTNHRVLIPTPWQCQYGIRRLENVGACPVFLLPMDAAGVPLPDTNHPRLNPGESIGHYVPPQGTHQLSVVCSNACTGTGRIQYEPPNA